MDSFLQKLGIELPILQAPMAGVSTPEMAAAVSNAGGPGSIAAGSVDAETTHQMIAAVRTRTDRPFIVNVFCHQPAVREEKATGEFGYGAQWAGQGAPLARALPATELVARLQSEMEMALAERLTC